MTKAQLTNLLGALAVALTDAQTRTIDDVATTGISGAAAITTLGANSGLGIDAMSRVLGLSHSATVRLADRLVSRGWVTRAPGADGRQVSLKLTASGRRLRTRLLAARHDAIEVCIGNWSAPDRDALSGLVSRLLGNLTVSRAEADHICRLCDETVCRPEICPVERKAVRLGPDLDEH